MHFCLWGCSVHFAWLNTYFDVKSNVQREEQIRKEQDRLELQRKKEEERVRRKEQERIEREQKKEAERVEKESKRVRMIYYYITSKGVSFLTSLVFPIWSG